MDVVYQDFQKAFNKVPHKNVLFKLETHGIGNDVINSMKKMVYSPKTEINRPYILFVIYIYIYIYILIYTRSLARTHARTQMSWTKNIKWGMLY